MRILSDRVVRTATLVGLFVSLGGAVAWSQAAAPGSEQAPPAAVTPEEGQGASSQSGQNQPAGSQAATDETKPSEQASTPATEPPSESPPAAYLTGLERLPPEVVETWLAQPKSVFNGNPLTSRPTGDVGVPNFVRLLVGSDNRAVPALVSLADAPDATSDQIELLARGLAAAAREAEKRAPLYALYIQEAVAGAKSENLKNRFQAALRQTETAALGTGTGGGAAFSAGTLGGGGDAGPGQYAGDDDVVSPASGDTGGERSTSASFTELGDAGGNTIICFIDASPTGCP